MQTRLLLLAGLLAASFVLYLKVFPPQPILLPPVLRSPCETAKGYALGKVDPRFNLPEDELLAELADAASIWNATQRKKLLYYDPSAALRIDFSYDERQELVAELGEHEAQLAARRAMFEPELESLKSRIPEFNVKRKALNEEIEAWNAKGGAPPDELARIRAEQAQLDEQARRIEELMSYAKSDEAALNAQAKVYNQTVDSLNKAVHAKPEQGLFEGPKDKITIFFGGNRAELVHTMAHELGHALGLLHVSDPAGVMFPQTNESTTLSPADRAALAELCRRKVAY
jgi:hypothetical protein